jgi:8-oxo-dGTP pyrophosphatase MutT (NUDIX family)
MAAPPDYVPQAAAIPVRAGRVCLVTSRSGKRWVIPKGCLEPGKTAGQIALQEAWEEAGLVGVLKREPVGSYVYEKAGNWYHVTVFLLHVAAVARDYPEVGWRTRRWYSPARTVRQVGEQGLRRLLRQLLAADAAALPA